MSLRLILRKSRVSPRESLLFTYSFLKKENGCSLKIISETSGIIHVSKDICERIRSYIKRMNLGKRGEELQALVDSGGDLLIDFDGDAAYANKEAVFFKPAGAWIHFAIDYLRALNTENYEDLFYATIKEKDVDELEKGRFWIFSYEMEFDGFLMRNLMNTLFVRRMKWWKVGKDFLIAARTGKIFHK